MLEDELFEINEEEFVGDGSAPSILDDDVKDTIQSLEISLTEEDKAKYVAAPKKRGPKAKRFTITEKDLGDMTDQEVLDSAEMSSEDQIKKLYYEFNSFLEDKTAIKQDSGVKTAVPTSIDLLDAILGGGFAVGSLAQIVGQTGGGKSMLAMQFLGSAQRYFNGDIFIGCLDSEESITTVRLRNLGVRNPAIKPYNDMTVEKVFKYVEGLCLYKEMKNIVDKPSVILWDSVANTQTQKERESDDPNALIGYRGRLLSLLIPKYISKIAAYNISIIAINQLRDAVQIGPMAQAKDLNFMQSGKNIPGGNALRYNSFHLLNMKVNGGLTTKLEEKYGVKGIVVEIKAVKNKLFSPDIPIFLVGNFVSGFSNFWTNYMFMADNGYINTGAWNTFTDNSTLKFRTKDAELMYKENQDFKEVFDHTIKTAIEKEILEPNTVIL